MQKTSHLLSLCCGRHHGSTGQTQQKIQNCQIRPVHQMLRRHADIIKECWTRRLTMLEWWPEDLSGARPHRAAQQHLQQHKHRDPEAVSRPMVKAPGQEPLSLRLMALLLHVFCRLNGIKNSIAELQERSTKRRLRRLSLSKIDLTIWWLLIYNVFLCYDREKDAPSPSCVLRFWTLRSLRPMRFSLEHSVDWPSGFHMSLLWSPYSGCWALKIYINDMRTRRGCGKTTSTSTSLKSSPLLSRTETILKFSLAMMISLHCVNLILMQPISCRHASAYLVLTWPRSGTTTLQSWVELMSVTEQRGPVGDGLGLLQKLIQIFDIYMNYGIDHIFEQEAYRMNQSCTLTHGSWARLTFHDVPQLEWLPCQKMSNNGKRH